MIRPVNFSFNNETAANNSFQVKTTDPDVQEKALQEFDKFVLVMRQNEVDVVVINDTPEPYTPDSLFPNNWISFHSDQTIVLYPMYAPNRREERKPHIVDQIVRDFDVRHQVDLSYFEREKLFLEGTGSMVLDRDFKIAYACLSPRTNKVVVEEFCKQMGYHDVTFTAFDSHDKPIYHTNVMMCVADRYVVVCLDAVHDPGEREELIKTIKATRKKLFDIRVDQMNHFAGNMLQVENSRGEKLLIMSTQAYNSLSEEQLRELNKFNRIVHSPLDTIESNGGGSARCMMAEIHLKTHK